MLLQEIRKRSAIFAAGQRAGSLVAFGTGGRKDLRRGLALVDIGLSIGPGWS
jgi:hypothetical protein